MIAIVIAATFAGSSQAFPRLAFGYERGSVEGVYVVRVDGFNLHRVTQNLHAGYFGFTPDWSPDGTRIAVAGSGRGVTKIFTVRPDGTGQRRLTNGPREPWYGDSHPDWSPNSVRIVFHREWSDPVAIFSVRRDGTQLTLLTDRPVYEDVIEALPRWSPDAESIAYVKQDEEFRGHIWVMRHDGTGKTQLTFAQSEASYPRETQPEWSPDSHSVVYMQYERAGGALTEADVCTVSVAGGAPVCLTDSAGPDYDAHYSPDGEHIVFVSERNGTRDIFVMNADGSNQHAVSASAYVDDQPEWSPDGRWIAFLSNRRGQVDLYVIHPDGSGLRRLTRTKGVEDAPTWSPR
jgi:Tol biopolymer transport system component